MIPSALEGAGRPLAVHDHEHMAVHPVPAAEHSTTTRWGREKKAQTCRSMLRQVPSGGELAAQRKSDMIIAGTINALNACLFHR